MSDTKENKLQKGERRRGMKQTEYKIRFTRNTSGGEMRQVVKRVNEGRKGRKKRGNEGK